MTENAPPARSRRRFLQFGMRTLLLVMLAAAVASWWLTRPEWQTTSHAGGALTLQEQVRRDDEGRFVRDGLWLIDDEGERRRVAGSFTGETPRGTWKFYRTDGTRELTGAVAAGRPDGEWTLRHADGSPRIVAHYAGGALHGEYREWHAGGQLRISGRYDRGRRVGLWTHYDEAGRKRAEGEYADDRRQGAWRYWDEAGMEHPPREFLAGREVDDPAATIDPWIARLREPGDASDHGTAGWALARIGTPAVPRLRELLRNGAATERARAAAVLGMLGPEAAAAVDDLKSLSERSGESADEADEASARCAAVVALGRIGPGAAAAIPALRRLAEADDTALADVALVALASIEPADTRHALALMDRHPLPDAETAYNLRLDELSVPLAPGDAGWLARQDVRTFYRAQPQLGPALAEVLRSGSEDRAVSTAAALGAMNGRSPAAFPALDAALGDARVAVRLAAVAALGEFPQWGYQAGESLKRASETDASQVVRDAAKQTLERRSGPGWHSGPIGGF